MFARYKRAYDKRTLEPQKRLRRNLEDLVAENQVSSARGSELLQDAAAAGVADVRPREGFERNVARDLRRRLLRGSPWPKHFQ